MAKVTLRIDQAALRREVQSNGGTLGAAANRAGRRVVARAKRNAPVDTGNLRQSISYEVTTRSGDVLLRVRARAEHAVYVHQGTGKGRPSSFRLPGSNAPGPSGQFIVPRRAKVLRFTPQGASGPVFRPRSRGQDAQPFLAEAVDRVTTADFL